MTVIGITGHSNLTDGSYPPVRRALLNHLRSHRDGLVGITCIARGADQIFADAVLELGGRLEIVLPAADYLRGIRDDRDRARCDAYITAARSTVTMPYEHSNSAAYFAASRSVIDRCDVLLAVWDGVASAGGTADAVTYAQQTRTPVHVVWPSHAARTF